jgi:predicted lipid-binding transport protein (Tim44 family)
MILGSLASGIAMGLMGAAAVWAGGHPVAAAVMAYAGIGSIGTVCVAALSSARNPDMWQPSR